MDMSHLVIGPSIELLNELERRFNLNREISMRSRGKNKRLNGGNESSKERPLKIPQYIELWDGLPKDLTFRESESTGGHKGLLCDDGKNYVWLVPDAFERDHENTYYPTKELLYASVKYSPDGSLDARRVWPASQPLLGRVNKTLQDSIAEVNSFNSGLLYNLTRKE